MISETKLDPSFTTGKLHIYGFPEPDRFDRNGNGNGILLHIYEGIPSKLILNVLRYFNFQPSFKLRWCGAQDLFGSQIPVATGGFKLLISCKQCSAPNPLGHKAL